MAPPTKGQGSKRPRSEGISEFLIVDTIPNDLWRWWTDVGSHEQRRIKEHLGHLVHLMEIDPKRNVIEALIPFWDPKNNVFRFSDFEMTPTLEEITSFMGKGSSVRGADLRNKKPIISKTVNAKKFLKLLKINQIEKESLKNGNQGGEEVWKTNGCFAFMVAFLGIIIFPKRDKHIDIGLAGVVKALTTVESPTIIPMILADMFRVLTKCINGEMYFEGCNILLQIWFLEHVYHHDRAPRFTPDWCNYVSSHKEREAKIDFPKGIIACEEKLSVITSDEIVWNYYWFPAKDVICMSSGISFLVLIGFRGVQPYAPLRVMRQLARVQEIPPNDDMSRFVFDTLPGFTFDCTDILKIWFGSIISELSEMVVEQYKGKVVLGYLSWCRNPATFGDIPEGSSRKRKDQHIIKQLEKKLEKAKATIARQEVQVQRGRNIQLELQDLEEHERKISRCVDIKEGQRQMIIERVTFRHQLEAAEERETLLRNNLGDHQVGLNNCYENMGRAKRQVHQLAEQTSYIIKIHRRMNDPEVDEQARAIVPHLPKVLLNLYETLGGQRKPNEDDED
ncbi:hypothetical protein KY290_033028 [Solanum tuberosum]|uniref:DUF7745 domain-containing protein n=1 Tax=Solanum tuberosum TaxID=4113 RepID=A0ABQ7U2Q8_SOLTU|nr:hypothetical protein KY290_033028 [Solanum tuberosum]